MRRYLRPLRAPTDPYVLVPLSLIGSFGVNVAYICLAQYTVELIPTCVRGQGVAAVRMVGYSFTVCSMYILHLVSECVCV